MPTPQTPEPLDLRSEEELSTLPALMPQEPTKPQAALPGDRPTNPEPVVVPRFRVLYDHRIMHRSSITILRAGKVVDGRNYNLDDLRRQGVQLQPVE